MLGSGDRILKTAIVTMRNDAKKNMTVMNKKICNFSRRMKTIKKKKKETTIQAYLMLLCSAVLGFLHLEI